MFTNNYLNDFIRKIVKESSDLTEGELKENFIKMFGEDKWIEEEMIGKLIPLSSEVSNYLRIDFLSILFEDLDEEDSRIYYKEEYIAINTKYKDNYLECIKSVIHELRHVYQMLYASTSNDKRAKVFKEELASPVELDPKDSKSITQYYMQAIELDAFAFTKWYLKEFHNIDVIHPSKDYETIICAYIEKYF